MGFYAVVLFAYGIGYYYNILGWIDRSLRGALGRFCTNRYHSDGPARLILLGIRLIPILPSLNCYFIWGYGLMQWSMK